VRADVDAELAADQARRLRPGQRQQLLVDAAPPLVEELERPIAEQVGQAVGHHAGDLGVTTVAAARVPVRHPHGGVLLLLDTGHSILLVRCPHRD
jgi:hypothetical protein